mmetsp:Transcript_45807/g.109063  ORF Transcript_45807/g.109063 Transcript_45807/m.109063 type:complete len:220 (-) Transcript_45807:1078-1737(-)
MAPTTWHLAVPALRASTSKRTSRLWPGRTATSKPDAPVASRFAILDARCTTASSADKFCTTTEYAHLSPKRRNRGMESRKLIGCRTSIWDSPLPKTWFSLLWQYAKTLYLVRLSGSFTGCSTCPAASVRRSAFHTASDEKFVRTAMVCGSASAPPPGGAGAQPFLEQHALSQHASIAQAIIGIAPPIIMPRALHAPKPAVAISGSSPSSCGGCKLMPPQ